MKTIKKLSATLVLLMLSIFAFAEETTKATNKDFVLDVDTMLVVCIGILAVVIISLANTVTFTMKYYKKNFLKPNSSSDITKALMFIAFMLVSTATMAQTPDLVTNKVEVVPEHTSGLRMLLYITIVIELAVIFFLNWMIRFFMMPEVDADTAVEIKPIININYKKIWDKLNQFKPIEEEASIDTGHSYDGIHELNNVTPPWFKVAFILSIIFAATYLYRYHVAYAAPLPAQEYAIEMEQAAKEHDAYIKTQKNLVDENNVVMLGADGIAAGKEMFQTTCFACHGKAGQGGVGPNLTDDYWLHGGGIKDVFKSIKYGWKDKGMQSWESTFSPLQIQQLASYVKSLHGTKPAGSKEPQGEIYVETKDSTIAKKDSAITNTATVKKTDSTKTK